MADGTKLNLGTGGDLIQTEDLGAAGKIQRIKVVLGALDADGGDVSSANPIPVTGTVTASQSNASNLAVAASQAGTWNIGSITTLPSIIGTVTANQANASNFLATVSGTVAATQSGTWNIGTVTTLPANSAFNLGQISGTAPPSANIAGTIAVGGAVSNAANVNAATNPLLIAGSDYGAIPKVQMPKVDASGGMYINVLGSIAATQSGTWNVGLINNPVTVNGTVTAVSANASNFLSQISGTVTAISANASNFLSTVSGTVTAIQSNASNLAATVSGTVSVTANSAFNLSQIVGTTCDVNSGTKSAGTQRVVIATDQPQLTNKLLVTPDANVAYNLSQILGTTVDANSGTKSAGTQRVVIATDQPQLTNKLLVTPDANTAYNLSQVLGQTVVSTITGIQDVMPRKFDAAAGLATKYFASRISSKLTTYVTNATAYLTTLKVVTSNAGTGATMNINDQSGSGNRTFAAPNIPGGNMITGTFLESYTDPLKLTGGIQVITGGTTFGDCNVFMTFWQ